MSYTNGVCCVCQQKCYLLNKTISKIYDVYLNDEFPGYKDKNCGRNGICLSCAYLIEQMNKFTKRPNRSINNSPKLCYFNCQKNQAGCVNLTDYSNYFNYVQEYLTWKDLPQFSKNQKICVICLYNVQNWFILRNQVIPSNENKNGAYPTTNSVNLNAECKRKLSHLKNAQAVICAKRKKINVPTVVDNRTLKEIPCVIIYEHSQIPERFLKTKINNSTKRVNNKNTNSKLKTPKKTKSPKKQSTRFVAPKPKRQFGKINCNFMIKPKNKILNEEVTDSSFCCSACNEDFCLNCDYKLHLLKHDRPESPFVKVLRDNTPQMQKRKRKMVSFADVNHIIKKWVDDDTANSKPSTSKEINKQENIISTATAFTAELNAQTINTDQDDISLSEMENLDEGPPITDDKAVDPLAIDNLVETTDNSTMCIDNNDFTPEIDENVSNDSSNHEIDSVNENDSDHSNSEKSQESLNEEVIENEPANNIDQDELKESQESLNDVIMENESYNKINDEQNEVNESENVVNTNDKSETDEENETDNEDEVSSESDKEVNENEPVNENQSDNEVNDNQSDNEVNDNQSDNEVNDDNQSDNELNEMDLASNISEENISNNSTISEEHTNDTALDLSDPLYRNTETDKNCQPINNRYMQNGDSIVNRLHDFGGNHSNIIFPSTMNPVGGYINEFDMRHRTHENNTMSETETIENIAKMVINRN